MKVKEENEKAGLKLNIQKTKIMASGPWRKRNSLKLLVDMQTSTAIMKNSVEIP